ncbi:MAG TPA: hypothetical protein VMV73_04815, partial [Candidatus Dormibacteraeota bacterium]|nr:hypothetical protein [Candidatus Dormibacteraeota bacterium]
MNCNTRLTSRVICSIAMVLVAFHPLAAPAGAPPSAAQYYQEALATMERLPTPPYLTYNVLTSSPGDVAPTIDQYRLRTHDDRAAYRDLPKGSWGLDTSHAFDPTWAGVYDFVQYGVAPLNPQASSPAPSPSPRANVKTKGLRIIAIVKAIAPSAYRISDRGAALCPDGAPGHALYLDAIRDPLQHMLTNVVIEAATGRFCSMRFSAAASVVAVGGSITIDLQFGSVG